MALSHQVDVCSVESHAVNEGGLLIEQIFTAFLLACEAKELVSRRIDNALRDVRYKGFAIVNGLLTGILAVVAGFGLGTVAVAEGECGRLNI